MSSLSKALKSNIIVISTTLVRLGPRMAPSLKQEAVEPLFSTVCGFLDRLQGLESSSLEKRGGLERKSIDQEKLKEKVREDFPSRGEVRNTGTEK